MATPRTGSDRTRRPTIVQYDKDKPDERFSYDYCRGHSDFFINNCLKIATKNEGLQPFILNYTQRQVRETIADLRKRGIPPRLIVLKSRQVGVSTLSEALVFADSLFYPHRSGLVLAHTKPAARGLLRMTRRFWHNLPPPLRMRRNIGNVTELEFENESRVQVEAVGEVRSYTAQSVHFSEFAFYENAQDVLIAVMQSVPLHKHSLAIIESTANGVGNKFHQLWINAINGLEDPDSSPWERGWVPIFIPWFKHEEYRARPWFSENELTADERTLVKAHHTDLSQLAWRRICLKINCDGDLDRFKVEYPSTWQEAFALSGRPVFDEEGLSHYRSMSPIIVGGNVAPPKDPKAPLLYHRARPCEVAWDHDRRETVFDFGEGGRFRAFKTPNPRHTYIIGADPSEGDRKSDPSPLVILDQMTLEFVGEWWGRTPPDMLADYAAWLGWYYNEALIIGEANNHGISFHGRLIDLQYPKLYFRTVTEETISGEITEKPGWWETNKAKHLLIDTFRKYVREKRGAIYSPGLLAEMNTTIYDRKENLTTTKIRPQPGHFIDRVMAAGMALCAHRGDITLPLTPLPEHEMVVAASRVQMLRERDPEAAQRLSLDLTGMSCSDLDRVLDARQQDRRRTEALGMGQER